MNDVFKRLRTAALANPLTVPDPQDVSQFIAPNPPWRLGLTLNK